MDEEFYSLLQDGNPSESVDCSEWKVMFSCPHDRGTLIKEDDGLSCSKCGIKFPISHGIPVIIDEGMSVFSTSDYLDDAYYSGASYGSHSDKSRGVRRFYRRLNMLLEHGVQIATMDSQKAVERMRAEKPDARILVIGAGDTDFGGSNVLYTDVSFGRNTSCICDAHSLPFSNEYFDGIVLDAVLEHVVDPYRCVEEAWRVLKPRGSVFAATPFLQPVHMGAHDFTRFTLLGHRRLFRWFEDVESGPVFGPATSAALALQHVVLSGSDSTWYRRAALPIALLVTFPLKQIDRVLRRRLGSCDAAAGVFFFGRKQESPIPDRELITLYRGAQK